MTNTCSDLAFIVCQGILSGCSNKFLSSIRVTVVQWVCGQNTMWENLWCQSLREATFCPWCRLSLWQHTIWVPSHCPSVASEDCHGDLASDINNPSPKPLVMYRVCCVRTADWFSHIWKSGAATSAHPWRTGDVGWMVAAATSTLDLQTTGFVVHEPRGGQWGGMILSSAYPVWAASNKV